MRAFLLGLTTGVVYFSGTLYWITQVMVVYGALQSWVAVLVVGGVGGREVETAAAGVHAVMVVVDWRGGRQR